METFNISNESMQKLENFKNALNCGDTATALNGNPTACSSCWGGTCANGFTG